MPRRQSGQNYQHLSIHGQWNIRISEFKLGAFSTSNNFHRGLSRPENRLSRACLVYKGWAFSMPGCSSMLVWRRFWPQPIVQPEQNQLWSTFLQIFPAQIKVHIRSSFFKLLRRITCPRFSYFQFPHLTLNIFVRRKYGNVNVNGIFACLRRLDKNLRF
jgi:hypothetical protein